MSIKEIKEAIEKRKVLFGIKQTLKHFKTKKRGKVFVVKDVREETRERLEKAEIKFEELKDKKFVAKELGLNFESEVFLVK